MADRLQEVNALVAEYFKLCKSHPFKSFVDFRIPNNPQYALGVGPSDFVFKNVSTGTKKNYDDLNCAQKLEVLQALPSYLIELDKAEKQFAIIIQEACDKAKADIFYRKRDV